MRRRPVMTLWVIFIALPVLWEISLPLFLMALASAIGVAVAGRVW